MNGQVWVLEGRTSVWQERGTCGPGAPVLHSAVDLHSVDVCLQDETWELEVLLLVSKHLLCQSTKNYHWRWFFPKDTVSISMKSLHICGVPFCLLSSLTCIIYDPSSIHGFFFFFISMNASCFGWHRTFSCSFSSWLMHPSKHLYFSFLAILTPVMICFSCRL